MRATVFPGQGSQVPGMGKPWVDSPCFDIVDEVADVTGMPVRDILVGYDEEALSNPLITQVAVFSMEAIAWNALKASGVDFEVSAGHSFGEVSALYAADVLSLQDAAFVVKSRAEATSEAASRTAGRMVVVVGLPDEDVRAVCDTFDAVWAVNFNCPGQVVISGEIQQVREAATVCEDKGAFNVVELPIGGSFHSPLMSGARDAFTEALRNVKFSTPTMLVASNADGLVHAPDDGYDWKSSLCNQVCRPVLWAKNVTTMMDMGVTNFYEVGAGKPALAPTIKKITKQRAVTVSLPDDVTRVAASSTTVEP